MHDHDHAHHWEHHSHGRDRRTGDERRRELVRAAYEAIAEHGFEGLRTREVARRAGVNIATLHYYFASKEDLIRGVVAYIQHLFITQAERAAARGANSARERLRAELWQAVEIKRDEPELQIVLHELFLRSLRDPAVHEIFAGLDTDWHATLAEIVHTGIREGSLRPDLDPEATASMIMAFIKGASIQMVRQPEVFDYARVITEIERWLTIGTEVSHTVVQLTPSLTETLSQTGKDPDNG